MTDLNNIWIVVPVGPREKYIINLLNKLSGYKDRIVFINNHKGYTTYENVHHLEDFEDINIHRWWNKGIDYAQKHGAKYVVVLNDDLDFDEDFVEGLYNFNYKNNYAVSNVASSPGAAWILDLKHNIRADENLKWWFGDRKIFKEAEQLGGVGSYSPNYFIHFEPDNQTTNNQILLDLAINDAVYTRMNDII
jgi:hypothetical protein